MARRKPISRLIGASPIVDGEVRSTGVISTGEASGSIGTFDINNSLRFDGTNDYLNKVVSASNRTTWTWSAWVKKDDLGRRDYFFSGGANADDSDLFYLQWEDNTSGRNNELAVVWREGITTTRSITTTDSYIDTSVWHHVVLSVDTTQSAADDKMKLYVNGTEVTSFTDSNGGRSSIDTNDPLSVNAAGNICMGAYAYDLSATGSRFKGQMAEVHFIDGTAYDASYFGETRDGVWLPKEVTDLTYGNNGFYLDFKGNDTGVTLLLDGDGTSGSTTFTDKSSSPHTITVNGDTQVDTTVKKFGSGSIEFDGSGDYLDVSVDSRLTFDGDFTVEAWVYPDTAGSYQPIIDARASNIAYQNYYFGLANVGGTLRTEVILASGATGRTGTTNAVPTGQWSHIAWVRNSGVITTYVNGVADATTKTDSATLTPTNFRIGAAVGTPNAYFDGYLDDIRITKGVARYTNSFTPPTAALTNTPEYLGDFGVDRTTDGTGVILLLDGSSPTTDLSSVENTITNDTGVSVTNITGPYDSTQDVLSFDGTSTLTFDIDSTMQLAGDFTVEAWVKRESTGGGGSDRECLWSYWGDGTDGARCSIQFERNTNDVSFYDNANHLDFDISNTNAFVDDTWFHIAIVRSGSTYECFVDGVSLGTNTGTTDTFTGGTSQSNKARIGALASGVISFVGEIADFRITKGYARYTNTFTPPTSALSADVSGITGSDDVVLLLDGVTATDKSSANTGLNNTGVAVNQNSQSHPYASGALLFNGTDDLTITTENDNLYLGTEDWTIEGWFRTTNLGTTNTILEYRTSGSDNGAGKMFIGVLSNGQVGIYENTAYQAQSATGAITTNTWYHLAFQRSGGTVSVFINGSLADSGSLSSSTVNILRPSSRPIIGGFTGGGYNWIGEWVDFRITKGATLYPFHPPISALTNDDTWDKPKNNFSVEGNITADDQLLDTPNLRFATWDTVNSGSTAQFREGNLLIDHGTTDTAISTMGSSAKFYAEMYYKSGTYFMAEVRTAIGSSSYAGYWSLDGNAYNTNTAYGDSFGTGSIIGVAADANTGTVWFSKNGVWQNGATASGIAAGTDTNYARTGLTGTLYLASSDGTGSDVGTEIIANFGQDHTFAGTKTALATPYSDANGNGEFYYQPPSGFLALATEYK